MYPLEAALYMSNEALLNTCNPDYYDWFKKRQTVMLKVEVEEFRPRWLAEGWTSSGYRIEKMVDGKSKHISTMKKEGGYLYAYYGEHHGRPLVLRLLGEKIVTMEDG